MEKKKYSSYAEIDAELEILKLEKEINGKKLLLSFQRTKESLSPHNIISNTIKSYTNEFSHSYLRIIKTIFPYVVGWFFNKKRG